MAIQDKALSVSLVLRREQRERKTDMKDIVIIGSGPAGLSAAVYGRRAGLDILVIEKEYCGTGQIAESGQVDNYLGIPGIDGYSLGEKFREHAENLGTAFLEEEVTKLEQSDGYWKVLLAGGDVLETKTVIYAAGASHRHLNVPGEDKLSGRGVSYCATCDGAFFQGKVTAVVGGGDTALDDALYLSQICEKVYLIHRRDEFRGNAGTVQNVKDAGNIEILTNARVHEIQGEQRVEALVLEDGRRLEAAGVFAAVGMEPVTGLLQGVAELDEYGYVAAGEQGITSAQGLFVAGDVRTKVLRQVITAAADGANAATEAERYIRR